MRIAVLLGGDSDERDVSLVSGCQVADALRQGGHDVVCVDPAKGVIQELGERIILKSGVQALPPGEFAGEGRMSPADLVQHDEITRAEVVFPALHGGMGEDGTLQALLDVAGIRYAGSGMLGCALYG